MIISCAGSVQYVSNPGNADDAHCTAPTRQRELEHCRPGVHLSALNDGRACSGEIGGVSEAVQKCHAYAHRPATIFRAVCVARFRPRQRRRLLQWEASEGGVSIGRVDGVLLLRLPFKGQLIAAATAYS